jgi:dimethylhistidine N-methyltransferase
MSQDFIILSERTPKFERSLFANDVGEGLRSNPKCIPSMYFYDDKGSKLWEQITTLPEYYPTRLETKIIEERAAQIAAFAGNEPLDVIELGAGCGQKTWLLLEALLKTGRDFMYYPIDISTQSLTSSSANIRKRFDNRVHMLGIAAEYNTGLAWCGQHLNPSRRKLFLFLGSNIGNLGDAKAVKLLLKIRNQMGPYDGLIVGFDAFNDLGAMQRAYADSAGVTTSFNLNLLNRINRELGGNFIPNRFWHHAFYDPSLKAMVSWLVANEQEDVTIEGVPGENEFRFMPGEGIRLEMSRKYSDDDIVNHATLARLQVDLWMRGTDDQTGCLFTDCLLTPI